MAKKPQSPQPGPEPHQTVLGDLLKARGFTETAPAPATTSAPASAQPRALDLSKQGKLVLRRERKGRGGKTVTVVNGLHLPPAQLEELARAMRKGLGCGSVVEQGTVVLQGDIPDRAEAWLCAHGATKVVRGN